MKTRKRFRISKKKQGGKSLRLYTNVTGKKGIGPFRYFNVKRCSDMFVEYMVEKINTYIQKYPDDLRKLTNEQFENKNYKKKMLKLFNKMKKTLNDENDYGKNKTTFCKNIETIISVENSFPEDVKILVNSSEFANDDVEYTETRILEIINDSELSAKLMVYSSNNWSPENILWKYVAGDDNDERKFVTDLALQVMQYTAEIDKWKSFFETKRTDINLYITEKFKGNKPMLNVQKTMSLIAETVLTFQ